MNNATNMLYIIALFFLFQNSQTYGQSIRKNHQEMTASEKANYVNGLHIIVNNPDVLIDLAIYHNDNFNSIHFNLPTNPANDVFLPFHRMLLFEIEQYLQNINENLSIPYWDWLIDNTNTASLWDNSFMGQFDAAWNLTRAVGLSGFPLPTQSQVDLVQSYTNFHTYSNELERGIVHTGGHSFVGGYMNTGHAPLDPIFHLHHCMVDKLWDEWEDVNQSSFFIKTSIPRYDGTHFFNGGVLPLFNPNNITKAKDLGVFYAQNQYVQLADYEVSNTYRFLENFYYQYDIDCGNDFIVPNTKKAKVESVHKITLLPGFDASYGCVFTAKIDEDINVATPTLISNHIPPSQTQLLDSLQLSNLKNKVYQNDALDKQ